MNITWRDEPLQLRPERGVYLPERGALLVVVLLHLCERAINFIDARL